MRSPAPRVAAATTTAVVLSVAAFVVLGIPKGSLGTAWPAIRSEFGRPVGDLGTMLLFYIGAYGVASAATGPLADRVAMWRLGTASAVLAGAGLTLFVVVDGWQALVFAAIVVGVSGGLLDTALNAYAAHRFTAGAMNLLHAGFGLGATLGPLVISTVVDRGYGWRAGYVAFVVLEAILLAVFLAWRREFPLAREAAEVPVRGVAVNPTVVLSLAVFFAYTGVEVTGGQWAFSVLEEHRGMSTAAAGAWVASYFGGLTAGRLALGALAGRLGERRVLSWSMVGSVFGATLFWIDPGQFGVAGLPLLGLSLAGVFPTLMLLTPSRVGDGAANTMVGLQLAAGSLGAAVLPWLVGLAVASTSLGVVAPMLTAAVALMALLHAVLGFTVRAGD